MSNVLFAFLIGVPSGVWIYSKMYERTGGDTKSAASVAAGAGLLLFIAAWILAVAIF